MPVLTAKYTNNAVTAQVFGIEALKALEDQFPSGTPEDSEHRNLKPDASGHGIQDAAIARKQIERDFLSSELDISAERIIFLKQIHGADVIRISELDLVAGAFPVAVADGMFTAEQNVALVVRTADCLPLFFHTGADAEDVIAGVIHCGWRGIARGIIGRAVDLLTFYVDQRKREKKEIDPSITVFPGPYICPSTYEVGHDVAAQFPIVEEKHSARGRPLLDLYKNAELQLGRSAAASKANLELIDPLNALDESQFRNFYSHRRGDRSRNLNVILVRR
ncbi:MAG: polyphenol oxidase family protein [Leptospiraceae bacterium]|nr:polyphenol oxidase family protein [Leptospiraceae bacterium]MCB1303117.1 polyphenol oxidase family protein [Leptospiraceae bacterium]